MVDFRRNRDERDDGRGAGRVRDDDRGRGRDDDRGRYSGRSDDRYSDDRGGRGSRDEGRGGRDDRSPSRGGGARYEYRARSAEDAHKQKSMGANEFDRIVKDGIKVYKIKDGENRLRVMPPTWEGAKHYGYNIYVHYGVGPDRDSYLDLAKMKDEPDPISEEYARVKAELRNPTKDDEEYIRELESKRRVACWVIDRDEEREGPQFFAMPWTLDRDLVSVSIDRDSGEVLPIDHPDDGYDIMFDRTGKGRNTKYSGVTIARRSSPLGRDADAWLEEAMKTPVPDALQYYDYETIAKAFGGGGAQRDSARGRRDDDRRDDRGGRRDDDRRDEPRGRGREEPSRQAEPDVPSWRGIHEMTGAELDDLIEAHRLNIDPRKARDDEDLADWICQELKVRKEEEPVGRRREDDRPTARRRPEDDEPRGRRRPEDNERLPRRAADDVDDKLAQMRRRRED